VSTTVSPRAAGPLSSEQRGPVASYAWRQSDDGFKGDPQRVGDALARIATENSGSLNPADVVAAARASDSPLHRYFEWDDRRAAKAHRLAQAEQLVHAVVMIEPDKERPTPAFVRLSPKDSVYTPIAKARQVAVQMLDPEGNAVGDPVGIDLRRSKARRLAQACSAIRNLQKSFGDLDELRPIMESIDEQLVALNLCQ
jgi:hypothetical protein